MGPMAYDKTLNCVLKISGFNDITLHKRQSIQNAVRKATRTNRDTHYSNSNKSIVLLSQ
jgi:hypothetical protein